MKSILILTQYYPPEIGAPQARLSELVKILKQNGFEVIVITAMPNYPTGKIYKGFGGFHSKMIENGVTIHRCFIYPTKSVGFVKRLANYFSFVFSSMIIGFIYLPKIDFLLTESPPLLLGISGYVLSRIKKSQWIFNVSDLWPDSAIELEMLHNKFVIKAAYALESFCYRHAWLVSGQSNEIVDNINKRFPNVATHHLSNGVDVDKFNPQNHDPEIRQNMAGEYSCVFLYAGLHGIAQGLEQILLANAKNENPDYKIIFVGDGPTKDDLCRLNAGLSIDNVEFRAPLARDLMPRLTASTDVALISLRKHLTGAVPSKLYEAMASGAAVIIIDDGEGADIVEKHRCGVVVKPGDLDGLSVAFKTLAENMKLRIEYGQAGRNTAENLFNRKQIVNRFMKKLGETISL